LKFFLSSDATLSDFSHCVFCTKPIAVVSERTLVKYVREQLSEMVKLNSAIFYNATMLTILSKSNAIIDSDTAEKSIADGDNPA
jgi:hypothetical protein